MITGIVVKNMNGYFYVQDDTGTIHECKVRGRLKQGRYSLLVGDRVTISEDGFVESIHERHNSMVRPAVANIDQVVLVVAAHEPDINELLLNKMLVMIEHADIPIVLCINKCDLMDSETKAMVDLYKSIGYEVLMTSTYNMTGIDDLRHVLQHKVTAFAGPISFVGIAVPHIVKSLLKTARPLLVIPACFLGGAVFCLFCDLIARTVFAPTELSISSVTAVFGAPVVIYIMIRRQKRN